MNAVFIEVIVKHKDIKEAQQKEPEPTEPEAYVEIYRGLRKEKMPLSK